MEHDCLQIYTPPENIIKNFVIGINPSVKDIFNTMDECYTHQGNIDSVHQALQALHPFLSTKIENFEDQEKLKVI